ncbi:MAG: putative glycoside hydrolase [Spirochaetes bacterium]|nr:putative glycoside hydrolase [Spirochaetota bacterium]
MKNTVVVMRLSGIACIIVGISLYLYSQHLSRVYYYTDLFRGTIISLFSSTNNLKSHKPSIKYYRVPTNIDEGFTRFGHFLFYITSKETTMREIAQNTISYTSFYTTKSAHDEIQKTNRILTNTIPKNTMLLIPNALPPYVKSMRNTALAQIPKTIGLYYNGEMIGKENTLKQIISYRSIGVNAIVFDAKDVSGIVNYKSSVPLVQKYNLHEKAPIGNVDFLIRFLKEHGIYLIARIAVFRDHLLYQKVPEFAIRERDGSMWNHNSNELWCDPTHKGVQEYAIALAEELAEKGVDEIQFDYIRFPTIGGTSRASFAFHSGKKKKEEIIEEFLCRAHEVLAKKNVRLSVDLFGIIAWQNDVDIQRIGQRIERLAKCCDVISPMLYPSHFNEDFDGFKKPGDNPYYFIMEGTKKFIAQAGNTRIRPWLQAFRWGVSWYNEKYIIDQIRACDDAGAFGYLFWNAANNYDTVFAALHLIKKSAPRNNETQKEKVEKNDLASGKSQ